ncbi:MAG: DsbA family protein [Deltaproteobacteria bacterium]|nr:DsbA family protein [Deltaproteobacteria bacterium]
MTGRIERLKAEYEIVPQWRAFPLHPETPEEGLTLERLFADYPVNVEEIMGRLKKTAADLGLPFGDRRRTYNSRLAQELGLWAESRSRGDLFNQAAFRAYFVDGKNIARVPVLVDLAASVGLPAEEAKEVLTTRAWKAPVDADWSEAREKEITAVPTLVMNEKKLVGAQPYEAMERFVKSNGARRRSDLS